MADIVFVGCSLAEAAAPLAPVGGAAPRRPVVLLETTSLSDTERAAILGDTACKLLRITS